MSVFVPALIILLLLGTGLYLASRSKSGSKAKSEDGDSPTVHRVLENVRATVSRDYPGATVSHLGSTDSRQLVILLMLRTDRHRDALLLDSTFRERFQQALVYADYPPTAIAHVKYLAQSQETVDRDFGGDWFEATR